MALFSGDKRQGRGMQRRVSPAEMSSTATTPYWAHDRSLSMLTCIKIKIKG
jgi:hypothetical protein